MRRWFLALALALAACSHPDERALDRAATPGPSPSATSATSGDGSPSPSAAPSAAPAGSVVLAVATADGGLSLYVVPERGRRATLLRELPRPDGYRLLDASLSGGASPVVCATWQRMGEGNSVPSTVLRCGDREVPARAPLDVAVRPDGRRLVWTEQDGQSRLVVADLRGGVVSVRERLEYAPDIEGGVPAGVQEPVWLADARVAVEDVADSGEGSGLCLVDLARPRPERAVGFGQCPRVPPTQEHERYRLFRGAVALPGGAVLTIEAQEEFFDDGKPDRDSRAVRLLPDGRFDAVVVSPRSGRSVIAVAGGPRVLVYATQRTQTRDDVQVSIRWRGEATGTPLAGLPSGARVLSAQG